MKDEYNGKLIKEFIGLKAKMYSCKIVQNDNDSEYIENKKIKGIKKSAVDQLKMSDFKCCLFEDKNYKSSMYVFRSKLHNLYTEAVEKISLCNADDKRIMMSNKIDTYAYGHYKVIE